VFSSDVATFCNAYPNVDVTQELVKGEYKAGEPIHVKIRLARQSAEDDEEEEEEDYQSVVAPFYLKKKLQNWWLVVGEPTTRQLLAIKRVTFNKDLNARLEFTLPQGKHDVKLYVICDSYMGADHEIPLGEIDVAEGEDSDSDEDMESGDEMEE
jgi:pre-mRNA-splicing helicase BRR2